MRCTGHMPAWRGWKRNGLGDGIARPRHHGIARPLKCTASAGRFGTIRGAGCCARAGRTKGCRISGCASRPAQAEQAQKWAVSGKSAGLQLAANVSNLQGRPRQGRSCSSLERSDRAWADAQRSSHAKAATCMAVIEMQEGRGRVVQYTHLSMISYSFTEREMRNNSLCTLISLTLCVQCVSDLLSDSVFAVY